MGRNGNPSWESKLSPVKLISLKSRRLKINIKQVKTLMFVTSVVLALGCIKSLKRKDAFCFLTGKCQIIPECFCSRKFFHDLGQSWTWIKHNSTCSDEASQYTTDQKVISFALHIPRKSRESELVRTFQRGILENLKKIRELYPGYVMRLYTDLNLEKEYCKMVCENVDLHWCNIKRTPSHGDQSKMFFMTWRFLPLGDPTVDIIHSRDLDSIITPRESAAVSDWLQFAPEKPIQVLRDNQQHSFVVLGGLWGAKNKQLGQEVTSLMQNYIISNSILEFDSVRDKKGLDQIILSKIFFTPTRSKLVVAYDSYHCKKFKSFYKTMVRPFPTKRLNSRTDFLGNTGLGMTNHTIEPCPVECRPNNGKHWVYC